MKWLLGMVPERNEPLKNFVLFSDLKPAPPPLCILKACEAGWGFVCCGVHLRRRDQSSGQTSASLLASDLFVVFGLSTLFLSFKCPAQNYWILSTWSGFIFKGLWGHSLMCVALWNEWTVYPLGSVNMPGALQLEKMQYSTTGSLRSKETRWLGRSSSGLFKNVLGNNIELKL